MFKNVQVFKNVLKCDVLFIFNLQIVLKLKRKLFFKNSLKIGSRNYLFMCYLTFVLNCNFRACQQRTSYSRGLSSARLVLEMASTVSNGNDCSEKWHRPFQMATTVYEREICGAAC